MSNKGRLPASGLGAKRPEQQRLFARLHKLIAISSFLLSLSLSLFLSPLISLHITPSLLLLSQHKRVSPALISHPHSPTLSLDLFISDKNSTCTIHLIPSPTCSRLAHHPHPGPCVINSSSASSSPSASIVFAFHRCHHPIDAVAFGCRLYLGHQHQRHSCWCSVHHLYFVWLTSCRTLELFGELCRLLEC